MTVSIASPPISRREARRIDRRDRILAVAASSFLDHGYAATTMSAIAAQLGGSKGTLWNHFPSKEELFAAVLDRATTEYRQHLSQLLAPGKELRETLRRFAVSLLSKVTSADAIALHRLVASEAGRIPEMGQIFYEHAPRHTRLLLASYLADAMTRGQMHEGDPEMAARALMTLCLSGCHQQMVWGLIDQATGEQIEADATFAVDLFLRAYAVPGESGVAGGPEAS